MAVRDDRNTQEVQPASFGLGLSRNLLLVTFEERELGVRGAA